MKKNKPVVRNNTQTFFYAVITVAAVFLAVMFLVHLPMDIISDDAYHLDHGVNQENMTSLLKEIYYHNGKFLTDGLAYLFYRIPFPLWKIIDTIVYGILLGGLWSLFTDRSLPMLVVCAMTVVLFPASFLMRSAGFIATSTNYLYTVLGLLLGITPLVRRIRREKTGAPGYILSFLGLLYAGNQDQTAVVAAGAFFLTGLYYFLRSGGKGNNTDRDIVLVSVVYFAVSAAIYLFMFRVPGHIERMSSTAEMERYLPQYAQWSTGFKFYRGMATTFAWLFFVQPDLVRLFCFGLLALCYIRRAKGIIIPVLLQAAVLAAGAIDSDYFIIYHDYAYKMPDLKPVSTHPQAVVLAFLIFAFLFFSVLTLWKTDQDLCAKLVILNVLGFGSRFMMGFSATLYASSFRTFVPQMFSFIICDILLAGTILREIRLPGLSSNINRG
ncbi:MAG: hypothetical protein Q4D81_00170 [Eubacteriales bacterium]|nr:hypothetical protein [Eubacteriales bacterium]